VRSVSVVGVGVLLCTLFVEPGAAGEHVRISTGGGTMQRPRAVTRMHDGHGHPRPLSPLVAGRLVTWLLALWSGYIATWAALSGSNPAIVAAWWLAGVVLLQATMARGPLTHQAHDCSVAGADDANAARALPLADGHQDWESEGGAIA
jgi:hypothetical protein